MNKSKPATEVIASYLLFRSAYKAHAAGRLGEAGYRVIVTWLTPHVDEVFELMFGADDAAAVRWGVERLGILASQGMLAPAEIQALRSHLEPRAAQADPGHQGSIGLLWRLHTLHQEVLNAIERREVDEARLSPIQAALHEQAIRAVSDASRAVETPCDDFIETAAGRAEELLDEMPSADVLSPDDRRTLHAGLVDGLGGPDESAHCRICGAQLEDQAEIVECAACATPHHADCWEYNGGCSIFGCGCVTGVPPAGPKPQERPVRFDLTRPRSARAPMAMRVMLQLGRVAWICMLLPFGIMSALVTFALSLAMFEAAFRLLTGAGPGNAGIDLFVWAIGSCVSLGVLRLIWKAYRLYPAQPPDEDGPD